MLDFYRKLYREIKKSNCNNKEKKLLEIINAVEAWKKNKDFGSEEVGGNGVCYECKVKTARSGHWNCEDCADFIPAGCNKRLTIPEIQKKLEQWSKKENWENMAEGVFIS